MLELFEECLGFVLEREGGFSNDPRDPGGATGAGGVTIRAVAHRDHDKNGQLDFDLDLNGVVDEADMRLLRADDKRIRELYYDDYWSLVGRSGFNCGHFGPRLALAVFDCAINSGPRAAVAILQRALGVLEDGLVGPQTVAAAEAGPAALERYIAERAVWYARLEMKQHSQRPGSAGARGSEMDAFIAGTRSAVFLRGWARRLAAVQTRCLQLAETAGKGVS